MRPINKIRNVAIIAHIDHGKTTLIDAIFRATGVFRENARVEERVMDNYELERERGITIRAKHCAVEWKGYLINIIDTPGHADFSGEVERVLSMVDAVLLVVDANEGPMPQTRYVLMRALRLGLKAIVVINKVDRQHADPLRALNSTFDLFVELGATDAQADFFAVHGSGLQGWFVRDLEKDERKGMEALFDAVIRHVPHPKADRNAPFLMQISTLTWNDYFGRIGCGRVLQGVHRLGEELVRTTTRRKAAGPLHAHDAGHSDAWEVTGVYPVTSTHLLITRGLERQEVQEVSAGDIVWIAGPGDLTIGDTLSSPALENACLPPLEIGEPTVSMFLLVNNGPFAGEEGCAVTMRQIMERLERERRVNVSLRVEASHRLDCVKISGRGELHLAILIEEMRREGMELCLTRPEVITTVDANGNILEPMEQLIIDIPGGFQGVVLEKVACRRGELTGRNDSGRGLVRFEFRIPTRGLIGYRGGFMTDTRGLGIMSSRFIGYGPWCGEVVSRSRGSMVSMDTGPATSYSLENLQSRGVMFVAPTERVYEGMIVGEHSRPDDLPCNPVKRKRLTNIRSSTKELDAGLKAPRRLTLESAIEWIARDELVEVTSRSIRVRKAILDAEKRKRAGRQTAAVIQQ
ncbi:MAG: translational GTPase TypA [Candidatus Aureabacteria bacterium]|nr:translational GTPase TypA [Candidatus Auribacterota bacterium]